MSVHFDALESRPPDIREAELFARLPAFLARAVEAAPALRTRFAGVDLETVNSRAALATLPVLRKSELMQMQRENPPFGGFCDPSALSGRRVFQSPGPIWEPEGDDAQVQEAARAFFAAGIRSGDVVHNSFSYHMTPAGLMLDRGARALGCSVFPAGIGNTDAQVDAVATLRPTGWCGTPDFLRTMLDRAAETGRDLSSIRHALVSGGALFPSLRAEYATRGVAVYQAYATAELGIIAYESADSDGTPLPGMVVAENLILEIVRPGTNDPVPDGEVGEVVVTRFDPLYPLVRLGTGDLSAIMPDPSPCGRTNLRIRGWMGRADQRTKVKGMFVDPNQVAELLRRHPEAGRARLVVSRSGTADVMVLKIEAASTTGGLAAAMTATLRDVTKLGGTVEIVEPGSLPNDGKVISDERDYSG